jgi:hypothetical protein
VSYLCLRRALVHITTLDDPIKFEAAVLVDRGEGIQAKSAP